MRRMRQEQELIIAVVASLDTTLELFTSLQSRSDGIQIAQHVRAGVRGKQARVAAGDGIQAFAVPQSRSDGIQIAQHVSAGVRGSKRESPQATAP